MWQMVLLLAVGTLPANGAPLCGPEMDLCEFILVVEPRYTMMHHENLTFSSNGKLYDYTVTNMSDATPINGDNVISADGFKEPKLVFVFNGSLPGPPIEVWEGQTVKIRVQNLLHTESISVHWHGMHQVGTPFMDGVGFVSQCPILPGQTFTYKFRANPKGTFWYHSPMGNQRSMGMYGPFIVHDRNPSQPALNEFIWTFSDWSHEFPSQIPSNYINYGLSERHSPLQTNGSDPGKTMTARKFPSGLLNGMGRYYDSETGQHNGAPLSVFTVTPGESYRVRVIGAGEFHPFKISVDQHPLTIIASDGYDLEPVIVDSLIINPGERFDFVINASQLTDTYWIRGQALGVDYNLTVEAILRYEGATADVDPTSVPQNCTSETNCIVLNCPSRFYLNDNNTMCVTFDELLAASKQDTPLNMEGVFQETFLNFASPGGEPSLGSVNGKSLKLPTVSAVSQPVEMSGQCENANCGEEIVCQCTWSLPLEYGTIQQFVFLNMGSGRGWSYPIHMHGHSFYVVKMGYARYNDSTGQFIGDNLDIDCRGNRDAQNSFCNNPTWANSTWFPGHLPGFELERPPRKDTLVVPSGGYAVVRIRAHNPGVWLLSSQIGTMSMSGRGLLLNESFTKMPEIPSDFPTCRSFFDTENMPKPEPESTPVDSVDTPTTPVPEGTPEWWQDGEGKHCQRLGLPLPSRISLDYNPFPGFSKELFWAVVGCLIAFIALLLFILIVYMCLHRSSGGRSRAYNLEPIDNTKYAYQNNGSQF